MDSRAKGTNLPAITYTAAQLDEMQATLAKLVSEWRPIDESSWDDHVDDVRDPREWERS